MAWITRAADRGYVEAQTTLGMVNIRGTLGDPDIVAAYKWFRLAADRGDERSMQIFVELEKQMTPAQLAQARRKAREWTPK